MLNMRLFPIVVGLHGESSHYELKPALCVENSGITPDEYRYLSETITR